MSAIGWIGFGLSTIGLLLNAHHRRVAQIVFIAGNAMWIVYAVDRKLIEVLMSQVLYLVLNARTLRAWTLELKGSTR